MPIIRRKLDPNTVYPTNIQYDPETDTVQTNVNGTFVDSPEADPRTQTTFPPRITANPGCDAAQSVSDAIKNQINQTIDAVNNAKTAFTIAGLILGLFTFGVFDIFIAIALGIANAMIDAGGTALAAALSDSTFDTLTCILFCHMNSSGRLKPGGLDASKTDVDTQIGGLGATIINAMLSLAGEGGINNIASLGMSTGDCSACDCGWCFTFDFTLADGGWNSFAQCGDVTTLIPGVGWKGGCNSCSYFDTSIEITFTGNLTSISYQGYMDAGSLFPDNGIEVNSTLVFSGAGAVGTYTRSATGSWPGLNHVQIFANCECATFTEIISVTFRGTGTNPFGDNNCE